MKILIDEATVKLALGALELASVTVDSFGVQEKTQEAITALREALAEQPAREWVGMTPQEISDTATSDPLAWANLNTTDNRQHFARAIEAKLKEKNT